MPSTSTKQARFMSACAHGAGYSSCPPAKVSKEFNQADKGSKLLSKAMKRADGGVAMLDEQMNSPFGRAIMAGQGREASDIEDDVLPGKVPPYYHDYELVGPKTLKYRNPAGTIVNPGAKTWPYRDTIMASGGVAAPGIPGTPIPDKTPQQILDEQKIKNMFNSYVPKRAIGGMAPGFPYAPQNQQQMPVMGMPPMTPMRRGFADGGDIPKLRMSPPIQPLSPYEHYNVNVLRGNKDRVGPLPPVREGEQLKFAMGGPPMAAPWYVKQEARNMMHSGPVMSAVPGRTDRHNVNVAAGSYVLPADHVSALGQSNTHAGFNLLANVFGKVGKGGGPKPKPAIGGLHMGFMKSGKKGVASEGGSRGEEGGSVPIIVAGGEYILTPDQVRAVGDGDIKLGHDILDHWVKTEREKNIKTLKKLPPPAKK